MQVTLKALLPLILLIVGVAAQGAIPECVICSKSLQKGNGPAYNLSDVEAVFSGEDFEGSKCIYEYSTSSDEQVRYYSCEYDAKGQLKKGELPNSLCPDNASLEPCTDEA